MSVEKRTDGQGRTRWVTRWNEGGRHRARVFDLKGDADLWDGEVKRRRRLGELGLADHSKRTVAELKEAWWSTHVGPNLAPSTREFYEGTWKTHVEKRLGKYRLAEVTPTVVEQFVADLRKAGVGPGAIHKALVILRGMFARAVAWGWVQRNPCASVKRPKGQRRVPSALSPREVEAIRSRLSGADAAMVSVLAYSGLRPGEMLALRWGDVRERTMSVTKAVSMGEVGPTKTGRNRTVKLPAPLVADLDQWRLASGRAADARPVLPGAPSGWSHSSWRNWRQRKFTPAVTAAGLPKETRPYDLRHACASLLIHEGRKRRRGGPPARALPERVPGRLLPRDRGPRRAAEGRGRPGDPLGPPGERRRQGGEVRAVGTRFSGAQMRSIDSALDEYNHVVEAASRDNDLVRIVDVSLWLEGEIEHILQGPLPEPIASDVCGSGRCGR
jgi:integrase